MLKKNIGLISLAFLAFFSESLTAKVFFWDGRDGQRHYSDQDPKGIEANEMPLTGDTFYSVIKVYDGDTVLLGNRLKVRLLSINTPEIERYNKPEEAGGESARKGLVALLAGQKVRLEIDVERQDKYGRTLAHLFTASGLHLNLEMVKRGWATVSLHPPNLKYSTSMLLAQQWAQSEHIALWGMNEYQPKVIADGLAKRSYGWQRLIGTVRVATLKRKYAYLSIDSGELMIRIPRANLSFFPDVTTYLDKKVEIRGWVSRRGKGRSVLVRHPSALLIR
ncbi:MAG: thermonuclease family protein [Methylococcaceae bacterium]|nr:thermonuclease family protein [Methylococcaceae bacterium]